MRKRIPLVAAIVALLLQNRPATSETALSPAAERGRASLLGRPFLPVSWSRRALDEVWKQWDLTEKPADFDAKFRGRYGLQVAPYENGGLPMGFREVDGLFGKGVTNDCLLCHGGAVAGKTYIGLGNASLEFQAMNDELYASDGTNRFIPKFPYANVRGTMEAAAITVYLHKYRDADLNLRPPRQDLQSRTDLCEDVPAWWLLKKKKTMYHTGSTDARSVRALMQFMLTPLNKGDTIKKEEATFKDIQAFLLSLEPPQYPFAIDENLARRGESLFVKNCAKCHGTYGPNAAYPNKVIPLEDIGTDAVRTQAFSQAVREDYEASWFAREVGPDGKPLQTHQEVGYQAPPLDGIWATAPYFHNGCAPTVYHVLNSKARPRVFTRTYRTEVEDYDSVKLGLKFTILDQGADAKSPAIERRKIYDTTEPGRSNGGHTFGDKFTEEERMAVIEYLKTL